MYFKSYFSKERTEEKVAEELFNKIYTKDVKVFIFFSSTNYNFKVLSKKLQELTNNNCNVIGCTSSGEIALNSGITKGGVSAVAFGEESMKIETIAIEQINKVPLFARKEIVDKFLSLGYTFEQNEYKNLTGILLVDGLSSAEEKVLSVINSIFDGKLDLIGGSAGDDLKFQKTLLSLNGEVLENGAILTLLKSNVATKLYKENIFVSQNISMDITKADERNRKIIEIDNKPAKTRYAELLGIQKNEAEKFVMKNPIGRKVGDSIYISSIANIEGETLNVYAQVFENTRVEILKVRNPIEVQKETLQQIKSDFSKIYGVLCINCILRFLQFEAEGNIKELSNGLSSLGEYGGFVSYGEQYKKQHLNQTLTMLVFGRKN